MFRTNETKAINNKLEIIKLEGQKFKVPSGYIMPTGFTLYHPEFGYFSFDGDIPYIPSGGRKTLKSILGAGGMLDFNNSFWLKEMKLF